MGELQKAFAGKDVVFLSITCDPDTDDPERLREYANKLGADSDQWLFLTGRLIYIRRVAAEVFTVALDKQTHIERLIVTDKWGNHRGQFHWNKLDEVTQLKQLVEKLLQETEPPPEASQGTGGRSQKTGPESRRQGSGKNLLIRMALTPDSCLSGP